MRTLHNADTIYQDLQKILKNCKSDHSLRRYSILVEVRRGELMQAHNAFMYDKKGGYRMNIYRVSKLSFTEKTGRVLYQKYFTGIKAARAAVPVKVHYSKNARGFVGYQDNKEYWIFKV